MKGTKGDVNKAVNKGLNLRREVTNACMHACLSERSESEHELSCIKITVNLTLNINAVIK